MNVQHIKSTIFIVVYYLASFHFFSLSIPEKVEKESINFFYVILRGGQMRHNIHKLRVC